MAPILINCAASLASDLIDGISEKIAASSTKTASASMGTDFASALASAQQTPVVQAAALVDQQATLTSGLMTSPEIKSALAMADPSKPAQLEIDAAGGVSLRSATGAVRPVKVSDATRAQVSQLYGMQRPGVLPGQVGPSLVLAVDPMHPAAPVWSTLPTRG